MKNLVFRSKEFGQIRTCTVKGETYFVGRDVAIALGYKNSMEALKRHVDEEDKAIVKHDTLQGKQQHTAINESGLYSLILSSKLDSARRFKRWVTSEVLPAIRKNGRYELESKAKELQQQNRVLESKKHLARRNHRATETADRLRTHHPEQHADRHHHTDCPRLRHESRRHESVALQVAHSAQGGRTMDSLHPLLEQGVRAKFLVLLRERERRGASKASHSMDTAGKAVPLSGIEKRGIFTND